MVVFQISAELFWGYNINVNPNNFINNEEIIEYLQNDLYLFLDSKNLQDLIKEAKKMKLHIHINKFELNNFSNLEIVYVCDCTH
jgi:folate-binding Fe-S cluster repair protein YgfZ